MTDNDTDMTEHPAATDSLHALVLNWAEATYNEPREQVTPMPTTSADEVIRSMLTESTGTHFLDSGGVSGRHWEENQESPPWDDAAFDVGDGYVTRNVYDFMSRSFSRDRTAVALEVALWADADGTPALGDAAAFAEYEAHSAREVADELGLPREIAAEAASVLTDPVEQPIFKWNTYNSGVGSLSQCIQGATFGGPYAEYAAIQVHQGADIRGGYTAPRVFRNYTGGWTPHEFEYACDRCEWLDYESCLHGEPSLLYCRDAFPATLHEKLAEADIWVGPPMEEYEAVLEAAEDANDVGQYDGAVFHLCDDGGIGLCNVR